MVLTILTTPKEPLKVFDLQHLKELSVIKAEEVGRDLAQAELAPISPRPRPPAEVEKITKCQAHVRRWLAKRQLAKRKKQFAERSKVANEILQTERDYVNSLKRLVTVWLRPLNSMLSEKSKDKEKEKETKAIEQAFQQDAALKSLFADCEVILGYNSTILAQLEQRLATWNALTSKLGDIFLKMASFLKAYTQYTQHYSKVQSKLVQLKSNPAFNGVLERLQKDQNERKNIRDYLIMPVQRIPRYNMLLQSLLKNTWTDHKDYKDLNNALQVILKVATTVEDSQKEYELMAKVLEIGNLLADGLAEKEYDLVTPSRRFLYEEDALELSSGMPERRHLYLFNDVLLECAIQILNPLTKEKKYMLTKVLDFEDVRTCTIKMQGGFPMGMELQQYDGDSVLYAFKNTDLFESWKATIDQNLKGTKERMKQTATPAFPGIRFHNERTNSTLGANLLSPFKPTQSPTTPRGGASNNNNNNSDDDSGSETNTTPRKKKGSLFGSIKGKKKE